MKDRYFSVEVKPTLPASKQHAAAFTAGDVLFDYTEFEIPKGTSRLIGATMITRPKGNATPTGNKFGAFLIFSKSGTAGDGTTTYGTVNSSQTNVPSNDFLGVLELETTTSFSLGAGTAVGMTGRASNTSSQANLLLTGNEAGSNVGYDKLYVAAQANGAFDFITINRINEGDIDTSSPGTTLVCDGSSMDLRKHFIADDVLHAHDDAVIGVVASVDSATNITLDEAISTGVLEDDDFVYNIHPIRLILHFEK